jgi:hypothetical protein
MNELDPKKTICVCKVDGREVGRIPATASNANQYLTDMALRHNGMVVDYEEDPMGLQSSLHNIFLNPR